MTEQIATPQVYAPIPPEVEQLGMRVIGCGIAVHRFFGPGYKELITSESFFKNAL